jgi:hypothetical protein
VAELEHADGNDPGGGAEQRRNRLAPCNAKLSERVEVVV